MKLSKRKSLQTLQIAFLKATIAWAINYRQRQLIFQCSNHLLFKCGASSYLCLRQSGFCDKTANA